MRDFLFVGDCALAAHNEDDLHELANCLCIASQSFGLTISLQRTEAMFQSAPGRTIPAPAIVSEGTKLRNVETFTYLGSYRSAIRSMEREMSKRLAKAGASFGRLWNRLWSERGLVVTTKLTVNRAVVLTSLLYGCETWTLYRRHLKTRNQFHLRCLRKIMCISWEERIPNTELLRRARMSGSEALIVKAQL